MRVTTVALLLASLAAQSGSAQGPGPEAGRPHPSSFGRLGISAGMSYNRGGSYAAQLGGQYQLTPENRVLSFRVEGYAAWSPAQSIAHPGLGGSIISSGAWKEAGAGVAALLHARPNSRVSPYFIASLGISQRWQDGTDQELDAGGQTSGPPRQWRRSYVDTELGVGVGVRVRVGSQQFRLEVRGHSNRWVVSLGTSIPF